MADRDALLKKLAALRAKTTGAGCTEAEAMAAAEKLAELLAEHGISEDEIGMTKASAPNARGSVALWRRTLVHATGVATNAAAIFRGDQVTFVGRDPGPEVAAYLFDVCRRAVERSVAEFRATTWYKRRRTPAAKRRAGEDYMQGMAQRLAARILQIFGRSRSDEARSQARATLALWYPETETLKPAEHKSSYDHALASGASAGDRVPLAHGVASGGRPLAIGGR